jgi:hypothetical protein
MLNLGRANLSNDPLHIAISDCVEQASVRKHANDQARGYLGASLIGDECLRKIQFEWMVTTGSFPSRVHSIFARGHYFEAETRQLLVDAGFVFAPEIAGELLPRLDPTCEDFRCKMCSHRERCPRYE